VAVSPAQAIFIGGVALVFVGERLLGAAPGLPNILAVGGALAVLVAVVLRGWAWRRVLGTQTSAEGHRRALRWCFVATAVGAVGLLAYALTRDPAVTAMGWSTDPGTGPVSAADRWRGVWGAIWPVLVGLGLLSSFALDRALHRARTRIPTRRVEAVVTSALVAGLAAGIAFPINYLGTEFNVTRDLSYFQTTAVGSATQALVAELEAPVDVRIWQAPTSDVTPELRGYFERIEGRQLRVEVLDHAAHPALASALSVPSNGWVTFTVGEVALENGDGANEDVPALVTDKFNVGEELDKARRVLRRLDEEVQEVLHQLGKGPRIAYLVQGHGELTYAGKPPDDRKVSGFRQVLGFLGFKVKLVDEVGWLAEGVPEDATLVLVLGPDGPYYDNEVAALRDYLDRGGALMIALEPSFGRLRPKLAPGSEDALVGLIAALGLRLESGVVASEVATQPVFHDKLDRANVLTNRYAVHPAAETLMQTKPADPLLFLQSGWLVELADGERPANAIAAKRTAVVRSLDVVWGDRNGNLDFDPDVEARGAVDLVYAVSGEGEAPFRVMVFADAGVLSDAALRSRANAQFAADSALWLIGAESLVGSTESEEDVKIEHSKRGQAFWFYATTVLVPAILMGLGLLRVRSRRRTATGGGQ